MNFTLERVTISTYVYVVRISFLEKECHKSYLYIDRISTKWKMKKNWHSFFLPQEHLIHCGQVLEQCPNSCNAYVARIRMRAHVKECPRGKNRKHNGSTERLSSTDRLGSTEHLDQQHRPVERLSVLEHDIEALRTVLNEEIRQRLHLITDVGNLRKQNQVSKITNNASG